MLSRFDTGSRGQVGLLVLVTAGLCGVNLLMTLLLAAQVGRMARKDAPSMVQLVDGKTITMAPQDSRDRQPQTITTFVGSILPNLVTWTGTVPDPDSKRAAQGIQVPDPGVSVDSLKVPTVAYLSSAALSDDFRKPFLRKIAEMARDSNGQGRLTRLEISNISFPEKVGEGQWKVDVVATWKVMDMRDPGGQSIPFNKQVFVRSVATPIPSVNASAVEKLVAQIRASGLEIYAIRDLERPNL